MLRRAQLQRVLPAASREERPRRAQWQFLMGERLGASLGIMLSASQNLRTYLYLRGHQVTTCTTERFKSLQNDWAQNNDMQSTHALFEGLSCTAKQAEHTHANPHTPTRTPDSQAHTHTHPPMHAGRHARAYFKDLSSAL